jgi:hypothetical protein
MNTLNSLSNKSGAKQFAREVSSQLKLRCVTDSAGPI